MKIKRLQSKTLLSLTGSLIIVALTNYSHAQEATKKKVLAPDSSELLKKGNTWTYAVTTEIPEGVKFVSTIKDKGKKTPNGMIYSHEEIQQSVGLIEVEALQRLAPQINIFFDGKLIKKQILEYREGSLFYYGTCHHDAKNPDLKKWVISMNPILLYNERSKIADKWSWTATNLPDFQFRVVGKDTDIEVQGTKYKADKIQMDQIKKGTTDIIQSKEIWFTKDIGIIKEKEKSYVENGKAIIKTLELKNFNNKPLIEELK